MRHNLSQRDAKHIWHPLTQHKTHAKSHALSRASGVYLYDTEGKAYIDAISSWYTAVYGHCNDRITGPVAAQMQQLDQVVFSGFTHEPAVRLSEKLIARLPGNQEKLFFSENGSTAVEVAIKMALQYHHNLGAPRPVLLAFESGFHGDTFGALSVSGLSVYNGPFEGMALEVRRIPVPRDAAATESLHALERVLEEAPVAGFIYEPLVQGAAAMKTHDPEGLGKILLRVRESGALLIADEVMTGFGKTGTFFASEQLPLSPDLICLSKALTAGLLPMGITSCSAAVFGAFYSDSIEKGFFHGHTYTANPLACSAALAALELLETAEMQQNIARITASHAEFARKVSQHPRVREARHIGVIFAMDLAVEGERYGNLRDTLYSFFMDRGVYLRPLGNTVYILPPYVITNEELQKLYQALEEVLEFIR
ncbi:adenosylmethionine--8-amino-7-oxononanoate transaminase [Robiginitalea sp. SC105]|uniref:adenosylmethionine--8-amino-7-oxononanoate transaminase n=1 Tax=Robiginitalea sp. SC105 TaxID=2762332 RepID=UPI00163A9DEE|nr:adenosylmethionine--8-amino-7-oxononanoate transaminase [Robiginitalea sp. SC105]MBC2837971.1 adenosylmethionine--8-amino-7-oxononanoate transaminase [Robiginitalea sp. SC105]